MFASKVKKHLDVLQQNMSRSHSEEALSNSKPSRPKNLAEYIRMMRRNSHDGTVINIKPQVEAEKQGNICAGKNDNKINGTKHDDNTQKVTSNETVDIAKNESPKSDRPVSTKNTIILEDIRRDSKDEKESKPTTSFSDSDEDEISSKKKNLDNEAKKKQELKYKEIIEKRRKANQQKLEYEIKERERKREQERERIERYRNTLLANKSDEEKTKFREEMIKAQKEIEDRSKDKNEYEQRLLNYKKQVKSELLCEQVERNNLNRKFSDHTLSSKEFQSFMSFITSGKFDNAKSEKFFLGEKD